MRTVVLVEDNPALQRLISMYVKRLGFEVFVTADGDAGVTEIALRKPDVVVLDLMLPRLSGYDVCERIRKDPLLAKIPILMISARTAPEDRAAAEEVGANAFLTKPFKEEAFARVVRRLLEEAAQGGAGIA